MVQEKIRRGGCLVGEGRTEGAITDVESSISKSRGKEENNGLGLQLHNNKHRFTELSGLVRWRRRYGGIDSPSLEAGSCKGGNAAVVVDSVLWLKKWSVVGCDGVQEGWEGGG
jgi:hypothetical protein